MPACPRSRTPAQAVQPGESSPIDASERPHSAAERGWIDFGEQAFFNVSQTHFGLVAVFQSEQWEPIDIIVKVQFSTSATVKYPLLRRRLEAQRRIRRDPRSGLGRRRSVRRLLSQKDRNPGGHQPSYHRGQRQPGHFCYVHPSSSPHDVDTARLRSKFRLDHLRTTTCPPHAPTCLLELLRKTEQTARPMYRQ